MGHRGIHRKTWKRKELGRSVLDKAGEKAVMSAMQAFAEIAPGKAMTQPSNPPMVLGVIVGNRGFFPDHLARAGRQEMISALAAKGIKPIVLGENDSKHGAVETRQEAARCADLFKKH